MRWLFVGMVYLLEWGQTMIQNIAGILRSTYSYMVLTMPLLAPRILMPMDNSSASTKVSKMDFAGWWLPASMSNGESYSPILSEYYESCPQVQRKYHHTSLYTNKYQNYQYVGYYNQIWLKSTRGCLKLLWNNSWFSGARSSWKSKRSWKKMI